MNNLKERRKEAKRCKTYIQLPTFCQTFLSWWLYGPNISANIRIKNMLLTKPGTTARNCFYFTCFSSRNKNLLKNLLLQGWEWCLSSFFCAKARNLPYTHEGSPDLLARQTKPTFWNVGWIFYPYQISVNIAQHDFGSHNKVTKSC